MSLGQLRSLTYLWLGHNRIMGTLPTSLGQMKQLLELYLQQNLFSGSIPNTLGQLGRLEKLLLHHNSMHGTIPVSLCNLRNLTALTLSDNALTGTIPSELSSSLEHIVLHRNGLTAAMPSFRQYRSLRTLTLFQQQLFGRLVLPPVAPNLSVVMVHSNRLSCAVDANYTVTTNNGVFERTSGDIRKLTPPLFSTWSKTRGEGGGLTQRGGG